MMSAQAVPYRIYWQAWLVLLLITLVMIFVQSPAVLIAGIVLKASIIVLWFMHLRYENPVFAMAIAVAIFLTGLILFGLLIPDALAM
jgi:caa(3)-type oxidase subunit IV